MVSGVLGNRGTPRQPGPCLLISHFVGAQVGVGSPQLCAGWTPLPAAAEGDQGGCPIPGLSRLFRGQWWWGWGCQGWEWGPLLPEEVFSESPSLQSFQ